MKDKKLLLRLGGAVMGLTLFCGCSSTPEFDIYVSVDDGLKTMFGTLPSVEVDLVGINESEKQRILDYDIDNYFGYGNVLRASLERVTFKFSEDRETSQHLSSSDPVWEKWAEHDAAYLAVLVNLPYVMEDVKEDNRRILMPFDTEHWYEMQSGTHYFKITPLGLIEVKN